MLDNVIERSSKAWGLGQNSKFCFPPARGAYFSIKSLKNPVLGGSHPKGSAFWEGEGSGRVGAIFCFWVLLYFFRVLFLIFFNFSSISNEFWDDLGRVLDDFGKVTKPHVEGRPAVCA